MDSSESDWDVLGNPTGTFELSRNVDTIFYDLYSGSLSKNESVLNMNDSEVNSVLGSSEPMLRHSMFWTIVLICAYTGVLLVGIVGNVMVAIVLTYRPRPHMRTVTNLFILNLAIADLLVIIFCIVPTLLSNIFVPWILGAFMCKAVAYVQGVSVCASVYSLVAVSLDRFLAIWFPMRMPRGLSKNQARIIILFIWLAASLIILPWAIVFKTAEKEGEQYCMDIWPESMDGGIYFLIANFFLCYVLPLALISISNGLIWWNVARREIPRDLASPAVIKRVHRKTRHGVLKMLTVVTLTFLISWLPLYIIFIRVKLGAPLTEWTENVISITMPFAQWFGASNSSCNPILYAFLNQKFRDSFRSLISCPKFIRQQEQPTIPSNYSTTITIHHHYSVRGRRVTCRNPIVRV